MNSNYTEGLVQSTAAPTNPIPAAIDNLGYAINALGESMYVLHKRLDRVLLPAPPSADNSAKLTQVQSMTSQMYVEIDGQRQRIESITADLQDVMNRLEV